MIGEKNSNIVEANKVGFQYKIKFFIYVTIASISMILAMIYVVFKYFHFLTEKDMEMLNFMDMF